MTARTLHAYEVKALAAILDAADKGRRVARQTSDNPDIQVGTARHLVKGPDDFALFRGDDIRDAYLRVTLVSGFDDTWHVGTLMDDVATFTASMDF